MEVLLTLRCVKTECRVLEMAPGSVVSECRLVSVRTGCDVGLDVLQNQFFRRL